MDFTVDLGEASAVTELELGPFGRMFLHIGGGARPDSYKIPENFNRVYCSLYQQTIRKKYSPILEQIFLTYASSGKS